jgi:hypothetical protein
MLSVSADVMTRDHPSERHVAARLAAAVIRDHPLGNRTEVLPHAAGSHRAPQTHACRRSAQVVPPAARFR